MTAGNNPASPKLLAGMGAVHHPLATKSSEAQAYFGRG
jgi:hypothetical protein